MKEKPRITIVDDDDAAQSFARSRFGSLDGIIVSHPEDVELDDLAYSDLVLVDLVLDNWNLSDLGIAKRPADGLALLGVLRSQIRAAKIERPIGFAIHSAELKKLAEGFPPQPSAHIISRHHNVDWVFDKDDKDAPRAAMALAAAFQGLPTNLDGDPQHAMLSMLGLKPGDSWINAALEQVERARPPVRGILKTHDAARVLRWISHRVLPFPCFLIDYHYLASRLYLSPDSLRASLAKKDSRLLALLSNFEYRGILSDFVGRRWWKAGIDAFIRENTLGEFSNRERIWKRLGQSARGIKKMTLKEPVVCLDSQLQILEKLEEMEASVRIQPEDWPAYAEQPWASKRSVARDEILAALVIHNDR